MLPGPGADARVLLGPGDDGAVLGVAGGRVVASTDVLVDGGHFRRDYSSGYDVGRKAAAQNLADIAAMGGRATALLVGLAAPDELAVSWVERLTDGLRDECAHVGASVVGGDVVRSPTLVIAVTALGELTERGPVTRSGARPGDLVGVVGRLGHAAAGLRLLRAGERAGELVDAHRRPEPPYERGPQLAVLGAHAMIDVSDGLLADVGHLATASGVGVDLDRAALRTLAAAGVTDEEMLAGGDDHALVAALPAGTAWPEWLTLVGRVGTALGVLVDGAEVAGAGGHEHFTGGSAATD